MSHIISHSVIVLFLKFFRFLDTILNTIPNISYSRKECSRIGSNFFVCSRKESQVDYLVQAELTRINWKS